jgi:hypothetical protein
MGSAIFVRCRLLLAATAVGIGLPLVLGASAGAVTPPPPPGWTTEDWASLSPMKQNLILTTLPATTGLDVQAKLDEIAANPDPGPDPESVRDATLDGPGGAYSTGLIDGWQGPLDPNTYLGTNAWGGLSADGTVLTYVFAGQNRETGQAVLVVQDLPWPATEDDVGKKLNEYANPSAAPPLMITRGSLTTIAFTDANGVAGTFDMVNRIFGVR